MNDENKDRRGHTTHRTRTNRLPRWRRLCAAGGVIAALATGCGSSSGGGGGSKSPSDAGGVIILGGDDGGTQSSPEAAAAPTFDGTTGKACTTDSDCVPAGDPNINVCSNDFVAMVAGVTWQPLPTPVCTLNPTSDNCDPAPSSDPQGLLPHFCDGPDEPTSPGLCVADNPVAPVSGMGTCQPKCTFTLDGSATTGCLAPDTCVLANFAEVQSGATSSVMGYGYCQGTCQDSADCPAQQGVPAACQTDVGLCTTQPVPRTLAIGDACSASDFANGACNCNYDPTSQAGYCTTVCVVGGTACPAGWVCDTGEPSVLNLGAGNIPITTQPRGLAGVCAPACSVGAAVTAGVAVAVDAGADDAEVQSAADASLADSGGAQGGTPDSGEAGAAGCPGGSTCIGGTVAGPDCVP
jgi:hypothetical protein